MKIGMFVNISPILKLLLFINSLCWADTSSDGLCPKLADPVANLVTYHDLFVPSPGGIGQPVYVKAWIPNHLPKQPDVLLFLHGRGSGSPVCAPSMIEKMGLYQAFGSQAFLQNPHIILAPQDVFRQHDNGESGADYWIGSEGRNWSIFLGVELPAFMQKHFGTSLSWKAMGVSMGAHGVMKLATDFPQLYTAFAGLSPVFRPTWAEIPSEMRDVFVHTREDGVAEIVNNLGASLLNKVHFHLPSHYITVHQNDFGLNPEVFPSARLVWAELQKLGDPRSVTEISSEQNVDGHSMEFWQMKFPNAMKWLLDKHRFEERGPAI